MISILYGLPGCGKSTTLAYVIRCNELLKKQYEKKMNSKKAAKLRKKLEKKPNSKRLQRKWENFSRVNFYTTFYSTDVTMQGTVYVDYKDLGKFRPKPNSCFLLEEAGVGLNSRDFAKLSKYSNRFVCQHRHQKCDLILVSQAVDIDRKYRDRCDHVFHLVKIGPFTWIHRIRHKLMVDESTHDIVEGYFVPTAFQSVRETLGAAIFHRIEKNPMTRSRIIFRPKYYPYFDSYEDVFDYPMEDPAAVYPDYEFVPTEKKRFKQYLNDTFEKLGFSKLDSKFSKGKKDTYYVPCHKVDYNSCDEEEQSFEDMVELMFA